MFKRKKTYVILTLIIAIIGIVYYYKTKNPQAEYITAMAKKGKLVRTVSVTGSVEPEDKIDLSFKTTSEIKSVNFDVGNEVKAGEIVAEANKETLRTELAQAQADLSVQRKTYALYKRRDDLYKHEQIEAQKKTVEKYQAIVNEALENIKDATLYAPMDGMVIKRYADPGEILTIASPVITIADRNQPIIESDVPESDIIDVKIGQKAGVSLDAFSSDETVNTEVIEIEPAPTKIQDAVYYKVKLKFLNFDERVKIGMSADADINIFEKDNVVMIPLRAMKTEGNKKFVEVLKADNETTEKINVETGLQGDDGMIEITSGLSGGENVIILAKES